MEKKTVGLFEEISSRKELDSINGGVSYYKAAIELGRKFKRKPKKTKRIR